ncbi:hypothetical protein BZG36_01623 [Bifiguratus adelaidae]|uniref:glycerol kinase n=1 Tax=Bifiguratus adelaidae TaxID=1938954 RepID=A0A261Y4U4_9FUNG|nr:hypothetical protein BZG36_01623 [Bifiguratus adelaidae]
MPIYVGSIDQGTTSSRFLIFDQMGRLVISHQLEFDQIYPHPGWIEHDPMQLLNSVNTCIAEALRKFGLMGYEAQDIKAIGITNQRETTLCWDRTTGKPLHNAIVWSDVRTHETVRKLSKLSDKGVNAVKDLCGLPITTYFSAVKMRWMVDNSEIVATAVQEGRAMFGTVDSWLIYNLTGGVHGGIHVTDVTNASRTMFMNIKTLKWDEDCLKFFNLPSDILPNIVSSAELYGNVSNGPLEGVPITGCLGDQQAALVGQKCFTKGEAKNTYGTGAFLLFNTGEEAVISSHGLLTTVGYQFGPTGKPTYALEGSIAVAGSAVKWIRDNLGLINETDEIGPLASSVEDTGGVYFVTAFSGLFAPYWRDDARGCIVGLTQYTNKRHIARATLEASCFQTRAILDAMNADSGEDLKLLKVDGGMSNSDTCMQIQADVLGIRVERPGMRETTALGAAIAAGFAAGVWKTFEDLKDINTRDISVFEPVLGDEKRALRYKEWKKAVERSFGWVDVVN